MLAYAEYLRSDSTLWRITIAYLYSCGRVGEEQADEVLMRVPLSLNAATLDRSLTPSDTMAEVVKDISAICREHSRESVRRAVCKVFLCLLGLLNGIHVPFVLDCFDDVGAFSRLRDGRIILYIC